MEKKDFRREYPKPVVYVAHSGETAKYTKYIMRFVREQGYIPISIFEAFDYFCQVEFYEGYKVLCLHEDISVMLRCDELWIFGEDAFEKGGVQEEINAWEKYKEYKSTEPIRYFSWKTIGVPKYDPRSKKRWNEKDYGKARKAFRALRKIKRNKRALAEAKTSAEKKIKEMETPARNHFRMA